MNNYKEQFIHSILENAETNHSYHDYPAICGYYPFEMTKEKSHKKCECCGTIKVVPPPRNGSKTVSPFFVNLLIN